MKDQQVQAYPIVIACICCLCMLQDGTPVGEKLIYGNFILKPVSISFTCNLWITLRKINDYTTNILEASPLGLTFLPAIKTIIIWKYFKIQETTESDSMLYFLLPDLSITIIHKLEKTAKKYKERESIVHDMDEYLSGVTVLR